MENELRRSVSRRPRMGIIILSLVCNEKLCAARPFQGFWGRCLVGVASESHESLVTHYSGQFLQSRRNSCDTEDWSFI